MSSYENFSSLPPNEERQFAIYEERSQLASQQATKLGLIVAGAVAAAVLLFALVVPPIETDFNLGGEAEAGERSDQLDAE
jgi:hypothetical protein